MPQTRDWYMKEGAVGEVVSGEIIKRTSEPAPLSGHTIGDSMFKYQIVSVGTKSINRQNTLANGQQCYNYHVKARRIK